MEKNFLKILRDYYRKKLDRLIHNVYKAKSGWNKGGSMKKLPLVICNKAKVCLDPCLHGMPHVKNEIYGVYCTEWGECTIGNVQMKVRCVEVKKWLKNK